MPDEPDSKRLADALGSKVDIDGNGVPFGDVDAAQARAQGERLADVGTWGPLQRVAKVAHAWKLLAAEMERDGIASVRDMEPAAIVMHAERLWVIPPPGGMVEGVRG
jgi:hypothetical protein